MISVKCKEKGCNKVIEAYTERQAETLIAQHMIKHQNEKRSLKNDIL